MPDHTAFSKNHHRPFRESDLFRQVFDTVVRQCLTQRLVGGEGFAADAGLVKAEANRRNEGDKGLDSPTSSAGGGSERRALWSMRMG